MNVRTTTERKVTVVITALLLAGALAFAWARSRQVGSMAAAGTEAAGEATGAGMPAGTGAAAASHEAAMALGRSVYAEECGFCHGAAAADRAEVGRLADELYRPQPNGAMLVDFLLQGAADREHPPFDHLTDERIAALLAYLLAYGDSDVASGGRPAITAQDVATRRSER